MRGRRRHDLYTHKPFQLDEIVNYIWNSFGSRCVISNLEVNMESKNNNIHFQSLTDQLTQCQPLRQLPMAPNAMQFALSTEQQQICFSQFSQLLNMLEFMSQGNSRI